MYDRITDGDEGNNNDGENEEDCSYGQHGGIARKAKEGNVYGPAHNRTRSNPHISPALRAVHDPRN